METVQLLRPYSEPLIKLRLSRNLGRSLKRGQPWVFADSLRQLPPAPPGAHAILLDNKKGREIAQGFYDAQSPLAFRVCIVDQGQTLDDRWAQHRFERALALRRSLFDDGTTGFRLFFGEGDGLPGLICDIYGDSAVIQMDGAGPSGFWHAPGIAQWLARSLALRCVYERRRSRAKDRGKILIGRAPLSNPVPFFENGVKFTADIIRGQKTGFFLDQRENRQRIRGVAAGRRVLNLFGYTGGFSVYAGYGGASHVTTVDLASPALELAGYHWQLNNLSPANHELVEADVFKFLEQAVQEKKQWELVIVDPPSFAPSKESVPGALQAYQRLITSSAAVTVTAGFLAAASCSSHVKLPDFLKVCEEGMSKARRRATLLGVYGLPADHPVPLAFPEFGYLKFVVMRVD